MKHRLVKLARFWFKKKQISFLVNCNFNYIFSCWVLRNNAWTPIYEIKRNGKIDSYMNGVLLTDEQVKQSGIEFNYNSEKSMVDVFNIVHKKTGTPLIVSSLKLIKSNKK